jgi:hypothetical protein
MAGGRFEDEESSACRSREQEVLLETSECWLFRELLM